MVEKTLRERFNNTFDSLRSQGLSYQRIANLVPQEHRPHRRTLQHMRKGSGKLSPVVAEAIIHWEDNPTAYAIVIPTNQPVFIKALWKKVADTTEQAIRIARFPAKYGQREGMKSLPRISEESHERLKALAADNDMTLRALIEALSHTRQIPEVEI